jgi:hypothetical protein
MTLSNFNLLDSIDDGGTYYSVAVYGDYAFCTIASGTNPIRIYDISDPENISLDTSISSGTFGYSSAYGIATSSDGNTIFVGSSNASGTIVALDVTNFGAISKTSELVTGNNDWLQFRSSGTTLFTGGFGAYDVSNPASMSQLDYEYCQRYTVDGTKAYIGQYNLGFSILDISNLSSFSTLASHSYTGDYCYDVVPSTDGDYCFVSDLGNAGYGLYVFDISNYGSITQVDAIASVRPYSLVAIGSSLAMMGTDNVESKYLKIYDVSDPENIAIEHNTSVSGFDLVYSYPLLLVAGGSNGFYIYDTGSYMIHDIFDSDVTTNLSTIWTSKNFRIPSRMNFNTGRADCTGSDQTIDIDVDGSTTLTKTITNRTPFRVPGKGRFIKVRSEGDNETDSIELATDMNEMYNPQETVWGETEEEE